jgi:hypothetical protein
MPAPQASLMQKLARTKFSSFALKVPMNWQDPAGGTAADHYGKAFKDSEKTTQPVMDPMPLFQPASMNKYHTDCQKMHHAKVGKFMDDTCSAICSAWGQWQNMASFVGLTIVGPSGIGGSFVPLPFMVTSGPMGSPFEAKYSGVIAMVLMTAWASFTATLLSPGLPFWAPLFATFPSPVVPPTPSLMPQPFAALTGAASPPALMTQTLKGQMVSQLGDATAPFHAELFEAICFAFEQTYNTWSASTMLTNVLGAGSVPTCIPPVMPPGPVVGVGNMLPGGLK